MGKTLIIAEKPSVATDISKVLGKFKKEKEYFESDEYVISSAVGHLVEIKAPESAEPKRGKWKIENLPVIPDHFDLLPISRTEARLKVLKKLLKRKDVDDVINACDAGREGELIFRYIMEWAKVKKPIKRLWLQSMTPQSIRAGFTDLRTDESLQPLSDAAHARSEADWLIGINGTRALTSFNSQGGGFRKTTVGRVQTPTLSILVDREEEIGRHVPVSYWEVFGTFGVAAGEYEGRWMNEEFKKPSEAPENLKLNDLKAERLWNQEQADAIVAACEGKQGTVEQTSKPSKQASPLLYDLTSLQREANSRFGFPARMTLNVAQALYEKHKALTYPRTDSRYLPDDYIETVKETLTNLKSTSLGSHADYILSNNRVTPSKRIFNQAKVSDHFAIIPTGVIPKNLKEEEEKLYQMVSQRFLAIFFPEAVYEITTRITRVEEHAFKTEGKVLKEAGWLAVYGKKPGQAGGEDELVTVSADEKAKVVDVRAEGSETRPPARYSEATLLSAMEGAGKFVEDEELRQAMSEKGLGTPATRAQIIENLIREQYLQRDGRELKPMPKAFNLLETIEVMKIPALASPETTGGWEYKLKQVEQGELSQGAFLKEIESLTSDIVESVRGFKPESVEVYETDLIDPLKGGRLIATLQDYRSSDGALVIPKAIAGRVLAMEEIRELLAEKKVGPLDGFMSRRGFPFSAILKFNEKYEVELDWGQNDEDAGAPPDFSDQEPLAMHPSGFPIYETPNAYVSEKMKDDGKLPVWRLSRNMLSQTIEKEQVIKLLQDGKTDVMNGFVSKKTKRPFKAHLILKNDGGVGFEFPPRAPKKKATKK
ncbi:MAG: DNA topoisomerase III [Verrucomicrobiota bacterium]